MSGYFRFRRRFRILHGLTLNLGKRSASLSVGMKGAHVTLGHGQTRTTVGLPGTGLSWTETEKPGQRPPEAVAEPAEPQGSAVRGWLWFILNAAVIAYIAWRVLS